MFTMKKYYAETLADFIYDLEFNHIPADVIRKAKVSILDNLGLALGGSDSKATQAVLSVVRRFSEPKESTVFRFGDHLSANFAALVNGTVTHSHDWTDTILPIVAHCGPVVVPTAIAMAEKEKVGWQGTDCISCTRV